jgi:L,D-transpeptidase catalytic domain
MLRPVAAILTIVSATSAFATAPVDTSSEVIISVPDQKLVLLRNGSKVATYPVSTSMFGLGDARGRMTTPLGYLAVEKKIGDNVPVGAVFHKRRLTGEILKPNAPGRDPITTRIIWLRGLEAQNAHAFQRCIYIHGTPEEKKIGTPASYGCIRMKSKDVADLYDQVPVGALVQIIPDRLPKKMEKAKPRQEMSGGVVAVAANVPAQPPPQKTVTTVENVAPLPPPKTVTMAAKVASQPSSEKTVTVEEMRTAGSLAGTRQKAKLAANTTVAKVAPQSPRHKTAATVAKVTPQSPPQITADMLAMPPSSSLKHF